MDTNGNTKMLLIKDLCSRLPYGVVVQEPDYYEAPLTTSTLSEVFYNGLEIKPYLRPMSSMTEGERNEYFDFRNQELQRVAFAEVGRESAFAEISDWLNAHHFDYRCLIEKGLALKAKEGMYKECEGE